MRKALLIPSLAVLLLASPVLGQDLVINEIFYDEDGGDVGCFTELKGPSGTDLTRYVLAGVNGNGGVVYATVALTGVIPGDGYYVVAQDSLVPGAEQFPEPDVNWQNGADQVQLWLVTALQDTIIIDSICYGSTADLECEGGTAGPDVGAGFSISRCPDGTDTDDNEADTAETPKTPGAENDCIIIEPTEVTVCQVQEVDENGFPIHYGELVHVIDPVVLLNDNFIFAPDRLEVYCTDGVCCTELFDYNYVDPYVAGQTFDVTGRVDFFNGKTEITDLTLVDLGMSPVPDPVEVLTGVYNANGEDYEACLIKFCHLEIVGGDPWPDEGSNALVEIDDGSGPTNMWIDRDTDIDGTPAPAQPFAAVGLGGQYDGESPYLEGYQLTPRGLQDILPDCEPTAVEQTTWGQIKSRYNK